MTSIANEESRYIRLCNKDARKRDQSHLFPINGKFNATELAISRLAKQRREGAEFDNYSAALEAEISQIVNDERNW